jgi:hypothetical protein
VPTAAAVKYLVRRYGLNIGDHIPPIAPVSPVTEERLDAAYKTVVGRKSQSRSH